MSGVCGIVRFDGGPVAQADLDRQMKAMAGRGPDRARTWRGGPAGLGALLMRVTHEDDFDAQPLRDAARDLTFVCDARLDNREAVAALVGLSQAALPRTPDSALIFAAYKAFGADCVEHLVGDFLFCVWDGAARTLTMARDHMGQRHAFHHLGDSFFAFASERKGLWALPDIPFGRPIDDAMRRLATRTSLGRLRHAIPPQSEALPGGSVLTVGPDGGLAIRQYWTPHAAPEHQGHDEAYYVDAYRKVLGEAVGCRLRRLTRPGSLMFAGGFDSTAIAGLAGEALAPSGGKLVCVSSVLPEDAPPTPGNARGWVELCRRRMSHLDVRFVTGPDLKAFDNLEAGFMALDSGHSENRFVTQPVLATAAASGARVVMDGNGGDYTLNPRDKGWFLDQLRAGRLSLFLREWRARRRFLNIGHGALFRTAILLYAAPWLVRRWRRWRGGLGLDAVGLPVSQAFRASLPRDKTPPHMSRPQREKMLTALLQQQSSSTGGYALAAAMHGLEFTQPFHDKRVVELALAIPDWMHVKNGRERPIAREALKDIYPPEYAARADRNDEYQPDFLGMAMKIRPKILADLDRMEAAGKLAAYFDFAKMRRMLTTPQRGGDGRPAGDACRQAIRAYIWCRYIEWSTRGNT